MHYMAVGHSPLIMDAWRYLLETFTEYSTMLLVYLAEKSPLHGLSRKKVMSAQNQKSGKAISPFLSDQVTYSVLKTVSALDMNVL